jgi:lipoate-protein ligase A
MASWRSLADVEQFRQLTERHAVARQVDHATVVLGSTQSDDTLSPTALQAWPVEVVRRRGGGGAVLLRPGDHLWVDAWIPRDDPLWEADVSAAATWAGEWWRAALGVIGVGECVVHEGRAVPGPYGATICFSGRGPGEVFRGGAKIMGLSQWRSREGALFQTCAYTHWEATPLVNLLDLDVDSRAAWSIELSGSAVGIEDLLGPASGSGAGAGAGAAKATLARNLLSTFPHWGGVGPPGDG